MLELTIEGRQLWDARREEFVYEKPTVVRLEHSLISLSKWESKWCVPFLTHAETLTKEQLADYIRCMVIGQGAESAPCERLGRNELETIIRYMNAPMTATWFADRPQPGGKAVKRQKPRRRSGRATTAEVIYAQMFALGIPKECEKWHLNRLLTLIRVCQETSAPPEKMSRKDALTQQRALVEARRKKLGTRG